jgi:lysophospholipase L1-like esterase
LSAALGVGCRLSERSSPVPLSDRRLEQVLKESALYARTNPPPTGRFESSIRAFQESDRTNPPPQHAILFIGSSIFRQWTNLTEQMAPLPVYNRAFGGSRTTDLLERIDQVVLPYRPRIIVYYCGSNDVNNGVPPAGIFDGFYEFVRRVHKELPETRIFYVSINRAPQKRDRWGQVDAANALVRGYCAGELFLRFIDVNPVLFDAAGKPLLEHYQEDQLHLQSAAYQGFAGIIRPVLEEAWFEAGR